MNNHNFIYFSRIFAIGVKTAKVTTALIDAFARLKGMIAGISRPATALTPVPIKMPVKTRFSGIITAVIAITPRTRPMTRLRVVFFFL